MSMSIQLPSDASQPRSTSISNVITQWLADRGTTISKLAYGTGIPLADIQALAAGEPVLLNAAAIESVAKKLGVHAGQLREFRLAVVLESLPARPPQFWLLGPAAAARQVERGPTCVAEPRLRGLLGSTVDARERHESSLRASA